MRITVKTGGIGLTFADGWLDQHPLTQGDLKIEKKYLKNMGIRLEYR